MPMLRDAVKYLKNPRVNAQRLKREQEDIKNEKKNKSASEPQIRITMASATASIAASAKICNSSSSTFRRGGSRSSLYMSNKNNNKTRKSVCKNINALRNFDYPEALLFDCDGVLCETERDGHRVTFNKTFKENGLDHEWGVELYGELLKIGGGKERMTHYFDNVAPKDSEPWKSTTDPEERKKLVAAFHKRKTEMFLEVVKAGELPLRPGVARLIGEALEAGSKVAVCSTSNEVAVQGIVDTMLPQYADRMPVFAGDIVPKKKPAPDVYLLAAKTLGVDPARCVVIEDTHIGLQAAKAAGMRCCVTKSIYSEDEDFTGADAVFDCLGEEGEERAKFHDLTTPGAFWLNPPLPQHLNGDWYVGEEEQGEKKVEDSVVDDSLKAILDDIEKL